MGNLMAIVVLVVFGFGLALGFFLENKETKNPYGRLVIVMSMELFITAAVVVAAFAKVVKL